MEYKLVVISGEHKNKVIRIKPPTIIGRSKDADITLGHPLVSRKHCEITAGDDGTLIVEDLESLNGTFHGEERISEPVYLEPGDMLTIGAVTFQAQYRDFEPALNPPKKEVPSKGVGATTETDDEMFANFASGDDDEDEESGDSNVMPDFGAPAAKEAAKPAAAKQQPAAEKPKESPALKKPAAADFLNFDGDDADENDEAADDEEFVDEGIDDLADIDELGEEEEEVEDADDADDIHDEASDDDEDDIDKFLNDEDDEEADDDLDDIEDDAEDDDRTVQFTPAASKPAAPAKPGPAEKSPAPKAPTPKTPTAKEPAPKTPDPKGATPKAPAKPAAADDGFNWINEDDPQEEEEAASDSGLGDFFKAL